MTEMIENGVPIYMYTSLIVLATKACQKATN